MSQIDQSTFRAVLPEDIDHSASTTWTRAMTREPPEPKAGRALGSLLQWARRCRPSPRRFAAISARAGQPGPLLTLDALEAEEHEEHDSSQMAPQERVTPDS